MGLKISDMEAASEIKASDLFETSVVNSGVYSSKKCSAQQLKDYIFKNNNGSIRGVWSGSSLDEMTNEDAGVWYIAGVQSDSNSSIGSTLMGLVELIVYKNSTTSNNQESGGQTLYSIGNSTSNDADSFWIQRFTSNTSTVYQRNYAAGVWTAWKQLSNENSSKIDAGMVTGSQHVAFSVIFNSAPNVFVTPVYETKVATNPYMCFAQVHDVNTTGFELQGFFTTIQLLSTVEHGQTETVREGGDEDPETTTTTTTTSWTTNNVDPQVIGSWKEAAEEDGIMFYWVAIETGTTGSNNA